jgi:septum formation protein
MNSSTMILLASASPRRQELLGQLDVRFTVAPANIDESILEGETPREHVVRLAREKALAGFEQNLGLMPALGSDTIVLLDGDILGKPASRAEAEIMLTRLSGQKHQVYSAVALAVAPDRVLEALNVTAVTFGEIPREWIQEYCRGEEPMDKAGAYAVQGGTGQFIRHIDGSYSGVMGLPLFETARLLREAGLLA